jgi:hypothetical protein
MSVRSRVVCRSIVAGVVFGGLLVEVPLYADIKSITGVSGNLCVNPVCLPTTSVPVVQDATTEYTITGHWMDHVTHASISPSGGVTATFDRSTNNMGEGSSIRARFTVAADATPGVRVVSLKGKGGGTADPFAASTIKIQVVRRGTITGSPTTIMSNYFSEANVTLVGTNLTNAAVDADIPGLLTRSIVSNSDTEIVVRLKFATPVGEAHGKLRFYDQACGSCKISPRYFFRGTEGTLGYTPVHVVGPNTVKSASVQTGSASGRFVAGQTSTVTVTLTRPVSGPDLGSVASATTQRTTAGSLSSSSGVTVFWKMEPLHAEPASGSIVVPVGQQSASFSVKTKGYIAAGNSAFVYPSSLRVELRTGDQNATAAPALKVVTFVAAR